MVFVGMIFLTSAFTSANSTGHSTAILPSTISGIRRPFVQAFVSTIPIDINAVSPLADFPVCDNCHNQGSPGTAASHFSFFSHQITIADRGMTQANLYSSDKGLDCQVCHGLSYAIDLSDFASNDEHVLLLENPTYSIAPCEDCHTQKLIENFWHFSNQY